MSDHGGHSSGHSAGKTGKGGKNFVEGITEGMYELAHKSGLGAFHDAPNTIEHLFGVEGKGGGGHGHEKHH